MEPSEIVNTMFQKDAFSQWLGVQIEGVSKGGCILKMTVTEDMLNGFGIAHGGITYSLADSALAFASNSNGKHALSVETSINHLQKVVAGDILQATAKEQSITRKLGIYQVEVNRGKELVALFKGMVYRTEKDWNIE
ncbi:hotdog fold thioesterase [Aegicerativicinus sediminis]|uniref:hotdog fold thioesterase n=1 Tax=Aegicerativicinus sediminis TaxID=2893202 RepID=UPI001E2D216E|nr:hotdog fold thioesterase [Aegicerativicinus sediminis]